MTAATNSVSIWFLLWKWGRWVPAALYCGAVSAIACRLLLSGVQSFHKLLPGFVSIHLAPLWGAALLVLLMRFTGFCLEGTGTERYILAVHGHSAPLQPLQALAKLLATVGSVGSGGSGGLAGPSLLIGAGLAQSLPVVFRAGNYERRSLHLMGGASMLAALFGAPIAAALLASEVLYRQRIQLRELPITLLGAFSGTLIYGLAWSSDATPFLNPPSLDARLLVMALLTAALAAGSGIGLVIGLNWARRYQRYGPGIVLLGALLTGALSWLFGSAILGWGIPALMAEAAGGGMPAGYYLLLVPVKVAATVFTVGSGGSGGVIGPALVIGGWSGQGLSALTGFPVHPLMWTGMAASLTAISNVPIAAGILMIELFGWGAWPYTLIGSGMGFLVARSWVAYAPLSADKSKTVGQHQSTEPQVSRGS